MSELASAKLGMVHSCWDWTTPSLFLGHITSMPVAISGGAVLNAPMSVLGSLGPIEPNVA